MDWAVLLKVVPSLEQLRYDPERKTMIRDGTDLYANPFDLRALRVALDLRRPGESVAVLSMGPPAAETALREALSLGADRAMLITDRALAGSDSLVTARVLERALGQVGHEVVLAGRWTTDSETGQVGPQIAGLLGVPVISSARAMARDSSGTILDITGDTEDGWSHYRAEPPLIITMGEKITKIRKPTAEETRANEGRSVERRSASDLGLSPEEVGLSGSPTVVASLKNEEPKREGRVFAEGSLKERVAGAVAAVRELLGRSRPALPSPVRPPAGPLDQSREVVALVTDACGELDLRAQPFLSEILRSLPGYWPSAAWIGNPSTGDNRRNLALAGAQIGYEIQIHPHQFSSRSVALAIVELFHRRPRAAAGVFPSNLFGREVAGQVSALLGLGLTGDAVGLSVDKGGPIIWSKPAFGGGIVAGIHSKTIPSLATLRPGLFPPISSGDGASALEWNEIDFVPPPSGIQRLSEGKEIDPSYGDLENAAVVVSVGMGIGGPDRLPALQPALERWHAALAATRRVVDAGWLPRQLQVGLTGQSLAPDLAILLGVSGATNHLVGWRRARVLLAINSSAAAPVFRGANVGIVGDWAEVLPLLTEAVVQWAPVP